MYSHLLYCSSFHSHLTADLLQSIRHAVVHQNWPSLRLFSVPTTDLYTWNVTNVLPVPTDITGYNHRSLLTSQDIPLTLSDIIGYTPTGPYWHYMVHPQVLTDSTPQVLTDITMYPQILTDITRLHPQVLTDITGYTPTGPYWHYKVHPQVLTDITWYTHRPLLTLQGYTHRSLLDITGYTNRSLLTLQGYTHMSLLTLQGYTLMR